MKWGNFSTFGWHLPTLIVFSVMYTGLAIIEQAIMEIPFLPDAIPKIKFTPVNQSSVLPLVPERLVSPGWSRVPSALKCAHRTLAEFPASRGFLYNSFSEVCTPLLWLRGRGKKSNEELKPEEGTMYLAEGVCRDDFQLIEYTHGGDLACIQDWVSLYTFYEARSLCNDYGAHLVAVRSLAKIAMIREVSESQTRWIGLDDLNVEGTFVWHSDGSVLQETERVTLFAGGEPNNAGGNQHCVCQGGTTNFWDTDCKEKIGFVCEMSLPTLNCVKN